MKVVYIAGPYRAKSYYEQEQNIRRAEALALEVWKLGAVALCPHLNTHFFQGALPDKVWLEGDLELVARCDAVLAVPGWSRSHGARREITYADDHCIRVFTKIEELEAWLNH